MHVHVMTRIAALDDANPRDDAMERYMCVGVSKSPLRAILIERFGSQAAPIESDALPCTSRERQTLLGVLGLGATSTATLLKAIAQGVAEDDAAGALGQLIDELDPARVLKRCQLVFYVVAQ